MGEFLLLHNYRVSDEGIRKRNSKLLAEVKQRRKKAVEWSDTLRAHATFFGKHYRLCPFLSCFYQLIAWFVQSLLRPCACVINVLSVRHLHPSTPTYIIMKGKNIRTTIRRSIVLVYVLFACRTMRWFVFRECLFKPKLKQFFSNGARKMNCKWISYTLWINIPR